MIPILNLSSTGFIFALPFFLSVVSYVCYPYNYLFSLFYVVVSISTLLLSDVLDNARYNFIFCSVVVFLVVFKHCIRFFIDSQTKKIDIYASHQPQPSQWQLLPKDLAITKTSLWKIKENLVIFIATYFFYYLFSIWFHPYIRFKRLVLVLQTFLCSTGADFLLLALPDCFNKHRREVGRIVVFFGICLLAQAWQLGPLQCGSFFSWANCYVATILTFDCMFLAFINNLNPRKRLFTMFISVIFVLMIASVSITPVRMTLVPCKNVTTNNTLSEQQHQTGIRVGLKVDQPLKTADQEPLLVENEELVQRNTSYNVTLSENKTTVQDSVLNITLPENKTSVQDSVLKITLPENKTTVQDSVLNITLPENKTTVQDSVLNITLPENKTTVQDSVLNITLPENKTTVQDSVLNITLPENKTTVPDPVLNITLPENKTTVQDSVLNITLPENKTTVQDSVLNITLPENKTTVQDSVLNITLPENKTSVQDSVLNVTLPENKTTVPDPVLNITLPENKTTVPDPVLNITLPENKTTVPDPVLTITPLFDTFSTNWTTENDAEDEENKLGLAMAEFCDFILKNCWFLICSTCTGIFVYVCTNLNFCTLAVGFCNVSLDFLKKVFVEKIPTQILHSGKNNIEPQANNTPENLVSSPRPSHGSNVRTVAKSNGNGTATETSQTNSVFTFIGSNPGQGNRLSNTRPETNINKVRDRRVASCTSLVTDTLKNTSSQQNIQQLTKKEKATEAVRRNALKALKSPRTTGAKTLCEKMLEEFKEHLIESYDLGPALQLAFEAYVVSGLRGYQEIFDDQNDRLTITKTIDQLENSLCEHYQVVRKSDKPSFKDRKVPPKRSNDSITCPDLSSTKRQKVEQGNTNGPGFLYHAPLLPGDAMILTD